MDGIVMGMISLVLNPVEFEGKQKDDQVAYDRQVVGMRNIMISYLPHQ